MTELILDRLTRIERQLETILESQITQEWYDTKMVADMLGRSAYSVREWCRLGRINAEKRRCGRGSAKEWMISHEEVQRVRSEGLLPMRIVR